MHYSHMAEHVRSRGRGEDTMLIHMTPGEVKGLQNLAMAHGGSLTINPDTGLPEAGFLSKLLPTLLGGLGMAFGIPPVWMGALGTVGGTAITGSLTKGLMAGLGAFGGASMAGAAGLGGAKAASLAGTAAKTATPAAMGVERTAVPLAVKGAQQVAAPAVMAIERGAVPLVSGGAQQAAKTGLSGIAQKFGDSAKMGLPGGIIGKAAPMIAGMGVLNSVSNAMTPTAKPSKDKKEPDEFGYTGPYQAHRQVFNPLQEAGPFDPTNFDSSEQTYFGPTTYTDAAGKPYIPGQKTTPTAANAASAMANPMMLTPEQRMKLFGYADGGQVGANQMVSPTQTTPLPAQQMMDGSYSMRQPHLRCNNPSLRCNNPSLRCRSSLLHLAPICLLRVTANRKGVSRASPVSLPVVRSTCVAARLLCLLVRLQSLVTVVVERASRFLPALVVHLSTVLATV